jgi:hypothetical protein
MSSRARTKPLTHSSSQDDSKNDSEAETPVRSSRKVDIDAALGCDVANKQIELYNEALKSLGWVAPPESPESSTPVSTATAAKPTSHSQRKAAANAKYSQELNTWRSKNAPYQMRMTAIDLAKKSFDELLAQKGLRESKTVGTFYRLGDDSDTGDRRLREQLEAYHQGSDADDDDDGYVDEGDQDYDDDDAY